MSLLGIKSKLFLVFMAVLVLMTGLNAGLATYLTDQQGEQKSFANLTRRTVLL
jgi:hypothetical protein